MAPNRSGAVQITDGIDTVPEGRQRDKLLFCMEGIHAPELSVLAFDQKDIMKISQSFHTDTHNGINPFR